MTSDTLLRSSPRARNMSDLQPRTRKTRIVCISDTHNQTPKLPAGDVLIHAGDLTNQGSITELQKTVEWIEKADFAAKIVVAGNHDITLDEPFFREKESKWKWQQPQDPQACRQLLIDSPCITYLEHEAANIYLTSPDGPRTCFKVFGSPFSPGRRGWAFQYWDEADAKGLWDKIEDDVDIVVTHTPAQGHCDKATKDERTGCPSLTKRLCHVRPKMHVSGHIHEARGAERIRWRPLSSPLASTSTQSSPVESIEYWSDPGAGSKKLSLVHVSAKSGRSLDNTGRLTRHVVADSLRGLFGGQPGALGVVSQSEGRQAGARELISTSSLDDGALGRDGEAGLWRRRGGGAVECRGGGDVGCRREGEGIIGMEGDGDGDGNGEEEMMDGKKETIMINAALLGPRIQGKAMTFNKPIVVDVELPVWDFDSQEQQI